MDPVARREFWKILFGLKNQGTTIFVSTPYMDEAEHCNTIGFIHYGNLLALDTPGNLKRKKMRGHIVEIKCDRLMDSLELLKSAPFVIDAAVYGAGLHAVVEDARRYLGDIRRLLEGAGINVHSAEHVTPSLEDVFVFLVEEKSRDKVSTEIK